MARIRKEGGLLIVPDNPTIPFITGDGVGKEITPVCKDVVDSAVGFAYGRARKIEWMEVDAGQSSFEKNGTYLPDETIQAFKNYLVGIKGPLMTPVGKGIRSLNVALRQELDLYVCQRPVRYFKGVKSPVKHPERVDMCVFRENTEDIYAGIEWAMGTPEAEKFGAFLRDEMGAGKVRFPATSAYGVKTVSKEGSERLVRAALRYAVDNNKPSVTLVHEGNIMKFTEGGFRDWGYALAKEEFGEYLDSGRLEVNDCICDAFLQNSLLHPEKYSVIATLNLNGDYVSDMLAAQVGGIGISPSANINYESGHAIFEATHGVAPDIAEKDIANPCSLILSAVMMLQYMGWKEAARLITDSLELAFREGRTTPDLSKKGNTVGTQEFGRTLRSLMILEY